MAGMRLRGKLSVDAQREKAKATSLEQATSITRTDYTHASNSVFAMFQKDLYAYAHTHRHTHTPLMHTRYTIGQKYCPTVLKSSATENNKEY